MGVLPRKWGLGRQGVNLGWCGVVLAAAGSTRFAGVARYFLPQMVARCTPNRAAIDVTLSPAVRAVRIASTSSSVNGVRARLVGVVTTPSSGFATHGDSFSDSRFVCSHVEHSLSSRSHVFGLTPPVSTDDLRIETCPA